MPIQLLLAMQAAGMVIDYMGSRQQAMLSEMGMKVQQAGIEANIAQTRLQAEDESLMAMKKLRQTLGTQIATFAARGTRTGVGSALSIMTGSLSNYASDERMRKLNLLGKVTSLRGEGLISRLQNQTEVSRMWQGFANRTLNRFSTSAEAYYKLGSMVGK